MALMHVLSLLVLLSLLAPFPSEARAVSVMDYGAKGDGKTDDTLAFQNAMDEVSKSGGGIVTAPTGDYLIATHLTIPDNVTLEGVWRAPTARTQYKGTTLLAVEGAGKPDGQPFIYLMTNSVIKGVTIFYPNQTKTNPPVAYPWTVASGGADNCTILDVLIVNPYQAVDFGTRVSGRHYIKGLYAQPLYKGLFIDLCYDVGRVEDVHFWPFWHWDGPLKDFMSEKATAFIIAKTDWEYMFNCFTLGYKVGFHFLDAGHGSGNALLTTCGSDIGPTGVLVDDCQGHVGVSFMNSQMYGDIIVNPSNTGPVKFTGCGLCGSTDGKRGVTHARIAGSGQVSFSNCNFITIDPNDHAKRNIYAESGGLSINGCDFMDGARDHVVMDAGVRSAVIVGNRFRGRARLFNNSKGNVVIENNVDDQRKEEPNAIVIDNGDEGENFSLEGDWRPGAGGEDYVGWQGWSPKGDGTSKAKWTPDIPKKGVYEVYVWYGLDPNKDHATNAPYIVRYKDHQKTIRVNQREKMGSWVLLGKFKFDAGHSGYIELTNDADGNIVADAVKFLPVK